MALPDVHMEPTVPTPAESVCGCVCPMATCFQNAQFNIEKMLLCQTLPPMKWLTKPHSTQVTTMTFSKCGGLQSCVQSVEWKNVPLCTSCLRKSSGGDKRRGEAFQLSALLQMCSFAATKPARFFLKKKKKQATVLVNYNFQSPLPVTALQQTNQTLVTGCRERHLTVEWAPQAEGRSCP